MTAIELARQAKAAKPHVRYAVAENGGAVGAWNDALGRFQPVAGRSIADDRWYSMPYEVLVNGQPVPTVWHEV